MDSLFSRADLAEMRALNDASLPHTCVISTPARTRTGGGFVSETVPTGQVPIPCRLSASSPSQGETLTADQLQAIGRWVLVVPAGTAIAKSDRVVVSGALDTGEPWTKALTVVQPIGPKTFEVMRKVICIDPAMSGR